MAVDPRIADAFLRDNGFPLEPHLIVLGLMGSHSYGTYLPPEELNAVDDKRGGWSLEQVKTEAERLLSGIEAARQRSPLKPVPDHLAAHTLLIELHPSESWHLESSHALPGVCWTTEPKEIEHRVNAS